MSHHSSRDLLRATRRAAGFSQSELATLLGLRGHSHLSRIERGQQTLQLEHVLRYEMLFGLPMAEFVPTLCNTVRNGLWEDITAALLADTGQKGPRSARKRKALVVARERIESLSN